MVAMEENTELEEGEACCYKDDDGNIDLDSLSYIDEKIQHVLGRFQKDFEGGVSAENLGAKFGGYGSFLPIYEHSPHFLSHPKTPQRNYSSVKSPSNLHTEAASHNTKAPSNVPSSMRLGTASHSDHLFHNVRVPSVDESVKKDRGISSNGVAERCTLKDDITNKSANSTDQRTLKFRIKMKSNTLAQKNAAIYSGLGLDNSPSSSMGNSPQKSEGMPPVSQENTEESPNGIIQVMTSFPIPGGVPISPLHDNLLYLIRKEKFLRDSICMSSHNGHQERCSMSTDESGSFVGDEHLLKKRKVRIVRQSEKQLGNSTCSENDMTLDMKKRLGNRTPDCKDFLSTDLKCTPLSSSVCDAGETVEGTGKASEVSKEVNKDGVKGRMVSVEAVKEESWESISGQDFDKIEKQNTENGFLKKVFENKLENSRKDNSTDPKNNGKRNTYMISKKFERDAAKCKVDQDSQKRETTQKGKAVSEGKNKYKGDQSPVKAVAVAKKDSFEASNIALIVDKESAGFGVTSGRSKMNKTKSVKDNKVRDSNRDSLKGKKSEWKIDGPPGHRAIINANLESVEKQSAYGVKLKERSNGNKLVNQLLDGPCIKDASGTFPIAENQLASEMVPTAVAAPQLIAEDWVCCDSCQKWRLLPTGIKPEQLPEKWLCSMLNWLPGMNRCGISEEETTKALYALYQMPISEGQNNMQRHVTGTAIGVSSGDDLQFGLNHKKTSSDALSDQGKKKHGIKEKTTVGINNDMIQFSKSEKNNAQESGKNRSLTNMNQHPPNSNPLKKSSSKRLSRLNNMIEEKCLPKEKEKQLNGGNRKHIRLKRKMEADQYGSGTPKKWKTENVCYADKQLNLDMDLEKVGLTSINGLPTKASGKDMRKQDECCVSENAQDKIVVPVKKGVDQAQVLSDVGSLDVTNSSKKDGSMKRRKLKDWMDNENHDSTFSLQGDKQCGEEGNASGFRKENKDTVLNTEAKSVTEGDDKLNREGGTRQVCLSGSRDQMAVGTEVRSVDKAQQPRKHRKNIASDQASYGIDLLGKDLGSGQLSLAATSSSSKVSGSHKARTNLVDVRGSPVESVTSSPLRNSNLDNHILAAVNTSGKNHATKVGLSSISSPRSLNNREGKLSVKVKERISCDLHPASHKFSSTEYQVEDAKDKAQAKTSSEVQNNHLRNVGGVAVEQHGNFANGVHHEEKVNKTNSESALAWQNSGKVTSLHIKEKDRSSGSEVGRDKIKVSASENSYSKIGGRYDSAVDPSYHASGPETRNDAKYSSPKFKREVDNISQKNSLRPVSSESGKQTEMKEKDSENSFLKVDAPSGTNRKIISQQNLIQDFDKENKTNPLCTELRDGKSKVLSSAVGEVKRKTLYVGSRTAPGYQKGDMSNGHPVHVSGNGDVTKLVRNHANVSSKVGVNCSSGNLAPDRQLTVTVSSPVRTNSSQTAFNTLEEAMKLKDTADHYKNSGFEFESNETYFEAALKFLNGAFLLENCHSESGKHGEMNQMQIYATTAKLFKSCAHEYERRQEMAAAALAYKCMEVAYMRVVYCKHSSTNRDWHELQSTLQMVSQGESPSSSASDVDNLNNPATVDKATFPRGTNNHVAGSQVVTARSRPNFVRLLDFTQDVTFAMEASRKCQSTFTAANAVMEEARNRDSITSIRRAIDFSFQDVEELVRLVWVATKAISRAGLGGGRE